MAWSVSLHRGGAGEFHARPLPDPAERALWWFEVERPALVLGSTQQFDVVDAGAASAAGVEVVRRRSGGGAVLVEPDRTVWLDVVLPAGDPLWEEDVGGAFHWLGQVWAAALADAAGLSASVHVGSLVRSEWSRLVCFAGLGPGEVTVAGRKAVGISQRRTRQAARFQCAAVSRWAPDEIAGLLALDPGERRRLAADLADAVAPLSVDVPLLRSSLESHLPP
jgi:lipoate-protein ligase A